MGEDYDHQIAPSQGTMDLSGQPCMPPGAHNTSYQFLSPDGATIYPPTWGTNLSQCPPQGGIGYELSPDMIFTDEKLMSVIAYCCIFVVSAIGNLTVFITLFR